EELARNPLTVLPSGGGDPLEATSAELVGQYAVRIGFSDGHSTGIYSWAYLREIDPGPARADA
ncbi:MAG: gamma-butyrobetaine hydroxylase-like domain-containing protein, partial [Phycisphaerales bacterium]